MRRYVLLAAVLAAACKQDPRGGCQTSLDCVFGRECAGGVCIVLQTDHQIGSRCVRNSDCVPWADCLDEACVLAADRCDTGADCAGWELCSTAHACIPAAGRCAGAANCEVWEVCNASNTCENGPGYCTATAGCQGWQQCNAVHACVTAPGYCAAEADCSAWQDCGADHRCALAPGMCGSSADCSSWDVCDPAQHTCGHGPGYCASSADCSPWEECGAAHACAAAPGFCSSAGDCEVWETCNASHTCENGPGYCASSADCAGWQQCNGVHACVAAPGFCSVSTECQVWEVCNAGHTCENGPQYCASSAACAAWQECSGTEHVCLPGLRRCGVDADCPYAWQACESDHVCGTAPGHCFDDWECPAGQLCYKQDHVCQAPPARCTGNWDCPWWRMCQGALGQETCGLYNVPGLAQLCDSAADCPAGMACPNHLCVNTWRATQVAAGGFVSCAVTSGKEAWCWGWNNARQLGGESPLYGGPLLISGTQGTVALANDGGSNLATYDDGTIRGWGYNSDAQLCEPADNPPYRTTPGPAISALAGVRNIHGYPLCGIDAASDLVCWGDNAYGPIPGAGSPVQTPTRIPGLPAGVTAFDAENHVCAVVAGELWCWASTFGNDCGQTGRTPRVTDAVPTRVDLGAPVVDVATAGAGFTCAIVQGGDVKCWGCNYYGNVGNGSTSADPVLVPTTVRGLAGPAVHVETADWTACALLASGGIQCWGGGRLGYLGTGLDTPAQVTPKYVRGLESGVTQLDMGMAACALKVDGTVWCWGPAEDWSIDGAFDWPFYYPVQVNAP